MPFDRRLLHYFVSDALLPYSEDYRTLERGNPSLLQLNGVQYSVHVSYVHDSGNTRENEDEDRIQIQRAIIEQQRQRAEAGPDEHTRVAFIGFFEGGRTFVAWDPRYVLSQNPQNSGSVYARRSHAQGALENFGAARAINARNLGEITFAIALPATALGFYLENIENFHALPNEEAIIELMRDHVETFTPTGIGESGEIIVEDENRRERFEFTRTAYPRDPRFKKWVLDAYSQTCCICGRQLGLVEAAHIIPHSSEGSLNEVRNGLAMCVEHHRLYDHALLLPGPDQRLVFNGERAEYLRQTNQQIGLEEVEARNGEEFQIPEQFDLQPSDEYLERGLQIRMGI